MILEVFSNLNDSMILFCNRWFDFGTAPASAGPGVDAGTQRCEVYTPCFKDPDVPKQGKVINDFPWEESMNKKSK